MKKIFAVSFLSLMAGLVATNVWAENHNLATVDYVQNAIFYANKVDAYQPDVKNGVMVTDKDGDVEVAATISQSNVDGLTTALDAKLDKSQIATKDTSVDEVAEDSMLPTVARMESAIANAKPDTSGLVDKAAVVISGGGRTMTGGAVATDANKDAYVPTVAYAQEMATGAYKDAVSHIEGQLQGYVPTVTEVPDGILVTDSVGGVQVFQGVPTFITDAVEDQISVKLNSPDEVCSQPGNCALVFAGVDGQGNPVLQWEKIARSVAEQTAE